MAELQARFEERYLPALRFVTVDTREIFDPQVIAITDLDDVPSGQLTKLIAPCILFSEDKDLREPGLAPDNWHEAAKFAIDVLEGATSQRAHAGAVSLPLQGSVALVNLVADRTGLSPWLIGALAVGGTALLLRRPERRKAVGKYVVPVLEAFAPTISEVRAVLKGGSEFIEPERYRWQFGRRVGPWRG